METQHIKWDYLGFQEAPHMWSPNQWFQTLKLKFNHDNTDIIKVPPSLTLLIWALDGYHNGKLGNYEIIFDDTIEGNNIIMEDDKLTTIIEVLNYDIFAITGKQYLLYDNRGVYLDPFDETTKTRPMINPVSWELLNNWKNGYHFIGQPFGGKTVALIKTWDNKIVECFNIEKIEKDDVYMLGYPKHKTKYFFDQDSSGHWFMIPQEKKYLWQHVCDMDIDDPKTWVAYEEFEEYKLDDGIEGIFFTDPEL